MRLQGRGTLPELRGGDMDETGPHPWLLQEGEFIYELETLVNPFSVVGAVGVCVCVCV